MNPTTPSTARPALAAAACALALSGCLGPAYRRPDAGAPAAFKEMPEVSTATWQPSAPSDAAPRGSWWALFGDPGLDELEAKVLTGNQSLKQAEAQYKEAVAVVWGSRAAYLPSVTADASAVRQRSFSSSGSRPTQNTFSLTGTASWEPDLWGRIGKTVDVAKESAQATNAQLENAKLSLQAQLAFDYFSARELDREDILLSSATESYAKALDLTKLRFNAGIASQADVAQAQTQLETARAQESDVALSRAKFEHAIAVLIGLPPASFSLERKGIEGAPPAVPAFLPARLLERRPDVAAAERQVAAANSTIGLARTAFFPNVTLSAAGGYESGSFAQWVLWPNRIWALGASAAGTIFDFGRHEAQYAQAKRVYDEAVANYRQTSLSAFQEVEDDLAALRYLEQEGAHQDAAVQSAEDSLRLETERYKGGVVSYLDVIQTQTIALNSERAAAQVLGRRMQAAVDLIRAMGGGWDQSKLPYAKAPAAPDAPKADEAAPAPKP